METEFSVFFPPTSATEFSSIHFFFHSNPVFFRGQRDGFIKIDFPDIKKSNVFIGITHKKEITLTV